MFIFGARKTKRKKKRFFKKIDRGLSLLKLDRFHTAASSHSVQLLKAELQLGGQELGHDKTRSEGVARDIGVLRIQILFTLQPNTTTT